MPYAPGVSFDPSPLAQGLQNLASGLVAGIQQKRKKQEESDKQTQALGFIRKIAPSINPELGGLDDKTLLEGIKSVGADNVVSLAQQMTEAAQRKQAAALQKQQVEQAIAAKRAELIRTGTNRDALQRAADPRSSAMADAMLSGQPYDPLNQPENDSSALAYIRAGGDDPEHMQQLNVMAANMAKGKRPEPGLRNFGKGPGGRDVIGLVDAQGNVSRVPDPKEATQTVTVGGEEYTVGPGNKYFDKQGKPVEFKSDKPMDPITGQMLLNNYQSTIGKIESHKKGFFESESSASRKLSALQEKANFQADQLGFQRPFPHAGTAPGSEENPKETKPPAAPYKREDIDAEIKRRGLKSKHS